MEVKSKSNIYDRNYKYVKDKITSLTQKSMYDDIFENLLNNQFIQSVDYDYNNNNKNLIKENTEEVLNNNDQTLDNYFIVNNDTNNNIKIKHTTIEKQVNEINILNNRYEMYELDNDFNNLSSAVCFALSGIYRILIPSEKKEYVKQLKYKMYLELTEKNLYKKFNYHKKRFKKSDLESQLMKFERLNLIGQEYLMDYFNINIIFYDLNTKNFLPYLSYNENKNVLIMGLRRGVTAKDLIYVPFICENTFTNKENIELIDKSEIFNPFQSKLKGIGSYKLLDLQLKCKHLQIDLFKVVNGKDRKKTKKDLYEDLKKLL